MTSLARPHRFAPTLALLATIVLLAASIAFLWPGRPSVEGKYLLYGVVRLTILFFGVIFARKAIGLALSSIVVGALAGILDGLILGDISLGGAMLLGAMSGPVLVLLALPALLACITAMERRAVDGVDATAFVGGVWFGVLCAVIAILGFPEARLALLPPFLSFVFAGAAASRASSRARWVRSVRHGAVSGVEIVDAFDGGRTAPWLTPPLADEAGFEVVVRRASGGYRNDETNALVRFDPSIAVSTPRRFLDAYVLRTPVRSREIWLLVAALIVSMAGSCVLLLRVPATAMVTLPSR